MSGCFDLVASINQAVRDPDSIVTNDVISDYEHHWRTADAKELRRLAAGSDEGNCAYHDAANIVDSRRV